jgi:hypothetical protein
VIDGDGVADGGDFVGVRERDAVADSDVDGV